MSGFPVLHPGPSVVIEKTDRLTPAVTCHGAQAGDLAEDSLRSLETAGAVPSPGKHGAGSVVGKAGMRQTTARLVIDYVTWRLLGGAETENGTGFIYRQVNVLT